MFQASEKSKQRAIELSSKFSPATYNSLYLWPGFTVVRSDINNGRQWCVRRQTSLRPGPSIFFKSRAEPPSRPGLNPFEAKVKTPVFEVSEVLT